MQACFILCCAVLLAVPAALAQAPNSAPNNVPNSTPAGAAPGAPPAPTQTLKLADTPLPKDPAAALDLLRKVNGLGEDTNPWHIHATYQTFDQQGKPAGTGTFEMWWASPTKYKQVFISDSFTQTTFGTEHGPMHVGYQFEVPYPESFLVSELIRPLPSAADVAKAKLDPRELTLDTLKLKCTMLWERFFRDAYPPLGLYPTYCSSEERPILRLTLENAYNQISRNEVVLFRDEYIARKVSIGEGTQPLMDIAVDRLEALKETQDGFFAPPPDALGPAPRPQMQQRPGAVPPMAGLVPGQLVNRIAPAYPAEAKRARIDGDVMLKAVITRNGRVRDIRAVTAPSPALAISAIQAVLQWQYSPYTLNGRPIEVATEITVRYRIGN